MGGHLWRNLWRRMFHEKQLCHAHQYIIIQIRDGRTLVLTSRLNRPLVLPGLTGLPSARGDDYGVSPAR
jgi:hypothetical protein